MGGVGDYEYAPYTLYTLGEGKSAQYSIAKSGSNETPRVDLFREKDANASIDIIGDTIYAWSNAGAPKSGGCSRRA